VLRADARWRPPVPVLHPAGVVVRSGRARGARSGRHLTLAPAPCFALPPRVSLPTHALVDRPLRADRARIARTTAQRSKRLPLPPAAPRH